MTSATVGALVVKELRQLRRAKRALVTAVVMPLIFMLFLPLQNALLLRPTVPAVSTVEPSEVLVGPGPATTDVCAVITDYHARPAAGIVVAFETVGVGGRALGGGRTDARGRACTRLSVQLEPGVYQLQAAPFLSEAGRIRFQDAQLVVRRSPEEPPPMMVPNPAPSADVPSNLTSGAWMLAFLLPFLLFIGASTTPTAFAAQTVLLERERRSLDLLLALPVSVGEVLTSKVVFTLLVSLAIVVPVFVVQTIVLAANGLTTPVDFAADLLLLLSTTAAAGMFTLVIALLTRELRATGNLTGLLSLPAMAGVAGILFLVPHPANVALAAGLMLALAGVLYWAAVSWLTFERYLE